MLQASYPAFGSPHMEAVTEVHLRRLDVPGVLHRRAVAVIKIKASCAEVSPCLQPVVTHRCNAMGSLPS